MSSVMFHGLLLALFGLAPQASVAQPKPKIVVIMTDPLDEGKDMDHAADRSADRQFRPEHEGVSAASEGHRGRRCHHPVALSPPCN